jgi:hypothetical protein
MKKSAKSKKSPKAPAVHPPVLESPKAAGATLAGQKPAARKGAPGQR